MSYYYYFLIDIDLMNKARCCRYLPLLGCSIITVYSSNTYTCHHPTPSYVQLIYYSRFLLDMLSLHRHTFGSGVLVE